MKTEKRFTILKGNHKSINDFTENDIHESYDKIEEVISEAKKIGIVDFSFFDNIKDKFLIKEKLKYHIEK